MARSGGITDSARALRQLAHAVDESMVQDIADAMVEAISDGLPDVEFDAALAADALAACSETAGAFLWGIDADPWIEPSLSPHLSDFGRTLARRGVDITVLIASTRLAQSAFWPAVMEAAERAIEDPTARMRALTTTFERFSTYLEVLLGATIAVFQEERDRTMRGAHARRHETIQALLKGQDMDVDGASRALGYELRRHHTALALADPDGGHDALSRLESTAREIATTLQSGGLVQIPAGSRALWVWIGTFEPPDRQRLGALRALEVPPGCRIAVGIPAPGVAGFRRSHEDALEAQRILIASHCDAPVTLYADIEIVSLLSHDSHAARALVARELAGLTGADRQSATLRETVLAFLRCGNSATAAGRDLEVHTNTVRYRIEKAQDILGRPLEGQQLQLQLALMLVDELGPAILPAE